jgi:hypothetical protein
LTKKRDLFTLSKTMRPLLLLAVILALPSAASEPTAVQADWRRAAIDARAKAALTGLGWRFEDDGLALDPRTKAPASKAVLDKALLDLRQNARRAALEVANLMLTSGKPLSTLDRKKIERLSEELPAGLAAAMLAPGSDAAKVRAMAEADLSRTAAYFDGNRTMAERRVSAQPVRAGAPSARASLPYYTPREQSVGEKIRVAAESEIGRDPFGRTVLTRLNGKNGKPDLPPILIEDLHGTAVAQYDFRRGAIVLDRGEVLSSVAATAPPSQASALRASLSTHASLLAYLESHPEAVDSIVRDNDAALVHELTHAWQDRRDPIFREMARGNIPDTQPLEYEEEAYTTKNLYLHSKLKNAPASVKMDMELADYMDMMRDPGLWRSELTGSLNEKSPSSALSIRSIEDIQVGRIERTKSRRAVTFRDRQTRAFDLAAMGKARWALAALRSAHESRMTATNAEVDAKSRGSDAILGNYYLVQAHSARGATDRIALIDLAGRYAQTSGNAALIEAVRKAKERKE